MLPGDAPAALATSGDAGTPTQPLVEILAVGHGRANANTRNTATAIGARLRVLGHDVTSSGGWTTVRVFQGDAGSGLHVTSHLRVREGGRSLQAWTSVRNDGSAPLALQAVSSLMVGRPVGTAPIGETLSLEGHGEWVGENRWAFGRLSGQDGLVTLDLPAHQHQDARGARSLVSTGSWSSGRYNPSGVILAEDGPALAWQVEHNGAWRAELGVRLDSSDDEVLVLGLFGPTDDDHAWTRVLGAGEAFKTVPVSVAASDGWQDALAELTRHRRALRRDPRRPVIVFNDYMNTLMGDPTTAKLLPLVDAAARAGAEYFCIDAGWYDDGGDWWDSVGLWEPSVSRFPDGGLRRVVDAIRAGGMVPGLWLEPEVVGVRSPLARALPDAAFLQRHGVRITEHGRHLLDLRHRDVVKHLDEVVDRLVEDFGVGYFKLDYNVTPGAGTDRDADSPGDGLLQQNRAHLGWIDGVLARHPGLVIENCASGAMRADYALLSRLDLQSTSDQQNPLLYPPIAVGALVGIVPEQAANWAYPQPDMTDEEIVFTLCTGLAGRLYLSGKLHDMTPEQAALVAAGVDLAKRWTSRLVESVPFWPLGLPTWTEPLVASGLRAADQSLVVVWWRGAEAIEIDLDLPAGTVDIAYGPPDEGWHRVRNPGPGTGVSVHVLCLTPPDHPHRYWDRESGAVHPFPFVEAAPDRWRAEVVWG